MFTGPNLFHIILNGACILLKVCIYGAIAIRVVNVKRFSVTVMGNLYATYISIGWGVNRNSFALLRFNVETTMKVVAAQFTKTSGKDKVDIHRIAKITRRKVILTVYYCGEK